MLSDGYFIANPDPESIPLFLNAFAYDMGLGVYQVCDDVFRHHDKSVVVPHLIAALQSPQIGVRWWASQFPMDFPSLQLLEPLKRVANSPEDIEAHYFVLASIGFIHNATGSPQAVEFLKERLLTETDVETREMLLEDVGK